MSRVMFLLSKKKDQMIEYKKLEDAKFDAKIGKAEEKVVKLKNEKDKFDKKIENRLAKLTD